MHGIRRFMERILFKGNCTTHPHMSLGNVTCERNWWLEPFYASGNASLATISATLDGFVTTATNHMRKKRTRPPGQDGFAVPGAPLSP